jgi:type I restriction enzyme S subunit
VERYAEYKDSGIGWIGKIPTHWDTCRLKNLTLSHQIGAWGDEAQEDDNDRICIRVADFDFDRLTVSNESYTMRNYAPSQIEKLTLSVGDILIEKSGGGDKLPVGRVVMFDKGFPALYANFLEAIRPSENVVSRYLGYVFASAYHNGLNRKYYNQTTGIQNLNLTGYICEMVMLPTLREQTAIAAYLDRLTAEIDTLLADLQAQSEMLDRYRRELIADAVTHGLDKAVPRKNSGVDWIGEMPAHWNATKTKWMFEIVKRIYGKEDRDVLSITQRGLKVKDIDSNEGQLADSYANYQVVNVNDFAMNSMDLLTGWVDCSPFEGVTSPDYRVFRFLPGKEQCHSYYKYLFQMCYKNRIFYRLGQGVSNLGRWRLQTDQFLNMRLPQPPIEEQERIAAYLDSKTAQVEGPLRLKA